MAWLSQGLKPLARREAVKTGSWSGAPSGSDGWIGRLPFSRRCFRLASRVRVCSAAGCCDGGLGSGSCEADDSRAASLLVGRLGSGVGIQARARFWPTTVAVARPTAAARLRKIPAWVLECSRALPVRRAWRFSSTRRLLSMASQFGPVDFQTTLAPASRRHRCLVSTQAGPQAARVGWSSSVGAEGRQRAPQQRQRGRDGPRSERWRWANVGGGAHESGVHDDFPLPATVHVGARRR